MALRLEQRMSPVCMLDTEEVQDRLLLRSSELWEVRPLFRDSDLGTKEAGSPVASRSSDKAFLFAVSSRRLLLFPCSSPSIWCSSFMVLFLPSLRALGGSSFAPRSGAAWAAELTMCSGPGGRGCLRGAGIRSL
jgi:hypothetical protein